jgi:hypothetical protein
MQGDRDECVTPPSREVGGVSSNWLKPTVYGPSQFRRGTSSRTRYRFPRVELRRRRAERGQSSTGAEAAAHVARRTSRGSDRPRQPGGPLAREILEVSSLTPAGAHAGEPLAPFRFGRCPLDVTYEQRLLPRSIGYAPSAGTVMRPTGRRKHRRAGGEHRRDDRRPIPPSSPPRPPSSSRSTPTRGSISFYTRVTSLLRGRSTIRIALSVNQAGPGYLGGLSRTLVYPRA